MPRKQATRVLRQLWCALFPVVAILILTPGTSLAEEGKPLRGVALVIGNGDYQHIAKLPNPEKDARAIEEMLSRLGFETTLVSDRNARRLKRDLQSFAEDATEADVAVVYYSGHGIEAGGENWLVPVDAELSALEDASRMLFPVGALIDELKCLVPVVVVMLDACRDSPFRPGTLLKTAPAAEALPVAVSGLGVARGAVRLSGGRGQRTTFGTVIGFAAEPGKVALDGPPGGTSPYAAALLRHLGAMDGNEFGTVMRMVAEEVYLKTGGRQRPWVNESLSRLLYFGAAPEPAAGEEGDILEERRRLLVTIAALPDFKRLQVERVASQGGVPMDVLYGMLRAIGQDVLDDPSKLEKILRTETERFAKILAEREAITTSDAEILRLTALADDAEREGALATATLLRERAKTRFREIEPTMEAQQAALDQRYIEGAEVFARSAETKTLAFDHLGAANDYAEAFTLVERRDRRLAWSYKRAEMIRLTEHGTYKGNNKSLHRAIAVGRQAVRIAEELNDRDRWAMTQNRLGIALYKLGSRDTDSIWLEESVVAFRLALEELTLELSPAEWAMTQNDLGNALLELGDREIGI